MNNQSDRKLPERVRDKKPGAVPAKQTEWQAGVCVCVCSVLKFYTSISPALTILPTSNLSPDILIKLCVIVSVLYGNRETVYICDECVLRSEVSKVVGNKGRCVSLLFGVVGYLISLPLSLSKTVSPNINWQLTTRAPQEGVAHTRCHTHEHTRLRWDNEVLLSFEYLIFADD